MTNYERIKNMSVEKMAKELNKMSTCDFCHYNKKCGQGYPDRECADGIRLWLESEVETE